MAKYKLQPSLRQSDVQISQSKADSSASYLKSVSDSIIAPIHGSAWKILVIDDDPDIILLTKIVLEQLKFKDRPVKLITGNSGHTARQLITEHADAAVILLDVVMETDTTGFEVVKFVREEMNNTLVRIILRTGQTGLGSELDVINNFDINDYKNKSELTTSNLAISVIAALRAYDDLITIQSLAYSNEQLEQLVYERTQALNESNKMLKQQLEIRLQMLEDFRHNQYLLAEAQRIANIGNFVWNLQTGEMAWSDQIFQLLGFDRDQIQPSWDAILNMIPEQYRAQVEAAVSQTTSSDQPYSIAHGIVLNDGRTLFVRQQGQIETLHDSEKRILIGTIQDITESHRSEEIMRKLSAAVEQTADLVMITTLEGVIEYVNRSFVAMTGYSMEEVAGKTSAILNSGKHRVDVFRDLWSTILRGEVFSGVLINQRKDGSHYYEEKTITPLRDTNGAITHFISTGKDITQRMTDEERLRHLVSHDVLTGLPNRMLLSDRVEQAIARARWHERKVAVLFLDVDRFKIFNDTLGHAAGDNLLIQMSQRLLSCVREGDTVARLGGDEFAVLLNDIRSKNDIDTVADSILKEIQKPFLLERREYFTSASIGISFFPDDGETEVELLKKADTAMYFSKSRGKNCASFYTFGNENQANEKLALESQLRRALERDQFELHYQPQLDIFFGEIIGIEALLRWNHPDKGIVAPNKFIPILEESGMILPVGEWVIRRACEQARARQLEGMQPLRVAVNVSINQFKEQNFFDIVENILNETGLAPKYLELEITESILINNVNEAFRLLCRLNELGVQLAIDDFGTGYSSMNYLSRLPFDLLKIDRSFIAASTNSKEDATIVNTVIALAHSLDMQVIAEGVETAEQLRLLHQAGCNLIQGYLCGKPQPLAEIDAALRDEGNVPFYRCLEDLR